MQFEKNDDSSHTITATRPGHDSIHPSTDFSEKALSENDPADDDLADHKPADNEPVTMDPEQAQPPAPIEIDGGYGWICVVCVFLINAHTWGINSVRSRDLQTTLYLLIFVAISPMVSFWPIIWSQIHFRGHQTSILPLSEVFPSVWPNSLRRSQQSRLEYGGQGLP
jgi:hypothetical protein